MLFIWSPKNNTLTYISLDIVEPEGVILLLNMLKYNTTLTKITFGNKSIIDDYIGIGEKLMINKQLFQKTNQLLFSFICNKRCKYLNKIKVLFDEIFTI